MSDHGIGPGGNPNCAVGDHDWRYGDECGCGEQKPLMSDHPIPDDLVDRKGRPVTGQAPHRFIPKPGAKWRWCARCDETLHRGNHLPHNDRNEDGERE